MILAPILAAAAVAIFATAPETDRAPERFTVSRAGVPAAHASTVAEALAAARRLRRAGQGAVVITFPAGRLRLDAPIVLGAADAGTPGAPLVLRAAAGGTIVSGAAVIAPAGARRIDDPRAAALPGFRFGAGEPPATPLLFAGGTRLPVASWPAAGYRTGWQAERTAAGATLRPTGAALPQITGPVLVSGYFGPGWAWDAIPAQLRDGALVLERVPEFDIAATARLRVTGALEPAPGDYAPDPAGARLAEPARAPVELAVAPSLLTLEGTAHVRVEGLAFERSRANAVRIVDSTDVQLSTCAVHDTGGVGIYVDGGQGVAIDRCTVTDTGGVGVWLSGGARASLLPSGHSLTRSTVTRWGRAMPTFSALTVWGVGTLIRGNRIAGGGGAAIALQGNDHRVEGNEIGWVVCEAEDAGAVYLGRDWTQRGMTIADNFLHDVGGGRDVLAAGVYLDDQASGAAVARNAFFRMPFGVILGGGRDNRIEANLFAVLAKAAVSFDARGTTWAKALSQPGGALLTNLAAMPYRNALWRQRYPALAALPQDRPGEPVGNVLRGNARIDAQPVWTLTPGFTLAAEDDRAPPPTAADRALLDTAEHAWPVLARLGGLDPEPAWLRTRPTGITACPR